MISRYRQKNNPILKKIQIPKSAEKYSENKSSQDLPLITKSIINDEKEEIQQRQSPHLSPRQNSWDKQFQFANQTLNEYKEKLEITYEVNSLIKRQMESLRIELQQAKEEAIQYKQLWEAKCQELNNICNGNHLQYERRVMDQALKIEELEKTNQFMSENLDLALQKIEYHTQQKEELKNMLKETQEQLHDSLIKSKHIKNNSLGQKLNLTKLQTSLKVPRQPSIDVSIFDSLIQVEQKDTEKIKLTYKRIMRLLGSKQQSGKQLILLFKKVLQVQNSEDFLKLLIQIELQVEQECQKQEYKTFRAKK